MKYRLKVTKQFKKDVKRCQRRGLPMEELKEVMDLLVETGNLPAKYYPHPLKGDKRVRWSVTSVRIGYCYGNRMITS